MWQIIEPATRSIPSMAHTIAVRKTGERTLFYGDFFDMI